MAKKLISLTSELLQHEGELGALKQEQEYATKEVEKATVQLSQEYFQEYTQRLGKYDISEYKELEALLLQIRQQVNVLRGGIMKCKAKTKMVSMALRELGDIENFGEVLDQDMASIRKVLEERSKGFPSASTSASAS